MGEVLLLGGAEQHWVCPNCDVTAVTQGQPNRYHDCRKYGGFSMPMVPAGLDCKVEGNEREDYINGDLVQKDNEGRPIMNAVITRDDGTDCYVYAPLARVGTHSD